MTHRVALIGIGNPWRGDDGVGWAVVEAAGRRLGDSVRVVQADGEPARLLDAWGDVDVAVVVDATRSEAPAGTVKVWRDGSVPAGPSVSSSSHAVSLAQAVALGRAVHRLPRKMAIVGVEVADVSPGRGLSDAVAAAVDTAVDAVVELVQAGSKATSSAVE